MENEMKQVELTAEELESTIKYCTHDVEQTMQVFLKTKANFDAHMSLIKTFDLSLSSISKTQAQLSAMALGCVKKDWLIIQKDIMRK